jgi:hypothetical protein
MAGKVSYIEKEEMAIPLLSAVCFIYLSYAAHCRPKLVRISGFVAFPQKT